MSSYPRTWLRPGSALAVTVTLFVLLTTVAMSAAPLDPSVVPLMKRSFMHGREYFVLRSGQAQLIAQADQVDLAPAFLYLVFDAQNNRKSARKEGAFNFDNSQGFVNSALEVVLGGFAFTALGHQMQSRWTMVDGIPAVEAVWWAGGLRVTERLLALGDDGLFLRRVELASVNLGGSETVRLRLSLPPGEGAVREGWLAQDIKGCRMALGASTAFPLQARPARGELEIGPLVVAPGERVSVDTLLLVQIPPSNKADASWSPLPSDSAGAPRAESSSNRTPIWVESVSQPRTELNWARPSKPCDEAFRSILVSFREPLRYRIHVPAGERVAVVLGFCEGYHKEAGQRVLEVQIEGQSRQTIDPVAVVGANVPMALTLDGRDENRDGNIEVVVAAAEVSKDRNPILNALWVFSGDKPSAAKVLDGSSSTKAAAFVHALQPETTAPGIPLPSLNLGDQIEKTRSIWAKASSVATEDATVREIFDKARFGLPGMVADNGVMNAGIFEYGAQWVRDTSNTLLGLVHAGHFELARRGFAYVLEHMVNAEGNAMIGGGFDDPDREQFDQMGELLHALKAYRDWTGDDSLLREHRAKLVALIERPLRPEFRDATTGMLHNRREFWERTLDDACELAYQTYVVLGLHEAAALTEPLEAVDRAPRWRAEADRLEQAMLRHPTRALVEDGRLIKRRSVTGEWVRTIRFSAAAPDVPLKTEQVHLAEPDATMALPIAFGLVDPRSALARTTLDELEKLWNARWFGGGYERYHSSGQCDQPGPWTFATCFILRAQHDAGLYDRSRRTLEWLNTVQGGRTGSWFEEIPLVRSQAPTAGVLPWTSGEVSLFIVRHLMGVRFEDQRLVVKPALFPGSPPVKANLRFRAARLHLEISGSGVVQSAEVNGQRIEPGSDGAVKSPPDFQGGRIVIRCAR